MPVHKLEHHQATTGGRTALLARIAAWLREMASAQWRALGLALSSQDRHLSAGQSWLILAFHLCGLLAIIRLSHQVFWIGLAPLLLIQPLAVSLKTKKLYLFPESLAPFGVTYAVLGLRLLIAVIARAQGFVADSLIVPDPWGSPLNIDLAITVSGVWALVAQSGPTLQAFGKRVHWATVLGCLLFGVALTWAALTYFNLRTSGVTASDPYAYVQMAVDLVQRGTLLHTFELVPKATGWGGLTLWPLVPIGYRSPDPPSGTAATVWPPGYSAFLAAAYWLLGEPGLYLLTPLLGLISLLALWVLCHEALHDWPSPLRFLAAGLAVLMLATSYQQVDRLVVPMADIPAQLFSTLVVLLALRGARRRSRPLVCLAGLCLGVAFAIRYTQVLLAAGVVTAAWVYLRRPRVGAELLRPLAWAGVSAGLAALPVFWYHQVAFGSPFGVGSGELGLLGLEHVPATFARVSGELLQPNEFLWVIPFAAWGAYRLWRNSREASLALLAWLLAVVPFHLLYQALRLRDLLSIFPVLALAAGVGMAEVLAGAWSPVPPSPQRSPSKGEGAIAPSPLRGDGRAQPPYGKAAQRAASLWDSGGRVRGDLRLPKILALVLVVAALWARTAPTWRLPTATDFYTFGYLFPDQRAAFDTLAGLTAPNGVVAASLNSGPIGLYANRAAVRPGYWSQEEWLSFVAHVMAEGRTVYVLRDSTELDRPLQALAAHYHVVQIAWLTVPYFPNGDGPSINQAVALYGVGPSTNGSRIHE
jgi:hypothetical protein